MNRQEIIQALMANEKPFGLMTEEMQALAKEIGRNGFDVYWPDESPVGWAGNKKEPGFDHFIDHMAYRLHPDYEEPGMEHCPIHVSKSLGIKYFVRLFNDKAQIPLSMVFETPGFSGFLFEDGSVDGGTSVLYTSPECGGLFSRTSTQDIESGNESIVNATHVLIRN